MATISSPGIGSNLDVNGIVSSLMSVEQRPLNALAKKEASYQSQLSAYGSIKGALSSFQSTLLGLSDIGKFQALSATSSDSSSVTASATSSATAGTYTLDVTSLAQSQKLAALGQASDKAVIGNGTLTFDFGTIAGGTFDSNTGTYTGSIFTSNGNGAKTVTIDASNNSLQGIRDAINNAKIGVTATIVNDGSGTPYRLALNSDSIGKTNSIKISVAGDAPLNTLLSHDPENNTGQNLSETATAKNAEFKVNGIAVSKSSNAISDVIQGVTLNLQKTSSSPVSVTVARDTAAIMASVTSFVKAYNDLSKTLSSSSAYNPDSKKGAALQGDATVRTLQSQVRGVLNSSISDTSGSLTTLTQIGVSFQKDGSLALNSTKLNTAISNNFDDIASLFAVVGKASDALVGYSSFTTSTKPGSYAVNVTAMATQGSATGNINLNSGSTTIAADTTINVNLDGAIASVALTAGTYTAAQLAIMVQSAINGTSVFSSADSSVAASIDGSGFMRIVSNRYGSASSALLSEGTGTPVSDFMGTATVASGTDVAGTIGAAGATGSGQFLTASEGDATGLRVQINGGITGARGTINFSHGYAYTLNQLSNSLLSSEGPLNSRTKGISDRISDIGKQREVLNARLADIQKRYLAQFTKLDTLLSSMTTTSSFLTQQLANLPNNNSNN